MALPLDNKPVDGNINKYFLQNLEGLINIRDNDYTLRIINKDKDDPDAIEKIKMTNHNDFELIKETLKFDISEKSYTDINKIHEKLNYLKKQYEINNEKKDYLKKLIENIQKN